MRLVHFIRRSLRRGKRRTFTVDDGFSPSDLLRYARDHMGAARELWRTSPLYFDSAGYLSHLAIELLFKALLLHDTRSFPATHDLRTLYRQATRAGSGISLNKDQERTLSNFKGFEALRYPNPQQPIEVGSSDWREISALFDALLSYLPHELRRPLDDDEPIEKGGRVLMVREVSNREHS